MNVVHPLFAASSWPFAVMLTVPALVVLFGLSFFFARTSLQRLANMLLGALGSVVFLSISAWYLFNASRMPPLREDDYLPIVAPTALAVGAAIGVALSVLLRKGIAWFIHRRTGRAVELPHQDSSFRSSYLRASRTGAKQSDPISIDPLYGRFTDRARKVMQLANQEAHRFNHEYIGTEHILLGLIKEGSGVAANVLKNLDIDLRKIRLEVEKLVQSGCDIVNVGKLPQTPRAKKVIEYSMEEARNLNHNYVGTEHILLGLLRERAGVALVVLMNLGLNLETVRAEILALLGHSLLPTDLQEKHTSDKPPVGQMSELKQPAVQCTFDGCSAKATFHLTYAERRKCIREAHLCEQHARKVLEPYHQHPVGCPGPPIVLQDAKHFDINLIVITEIYDAQVIYLCEVGGKRRIPVLTGIFEAAALDRKLKGYQSPRPLTHDTTAMIIRAFGSEVQDVIVDGFEDRTYYAKVRIRQGNDLTIVDLRPSDAFILAVAFDCPIFFLDKVLEKVL